MGGVGMEKPNTRAGLTPRWESSQRENRKPEAGPGFCVWDELPEPGPSRRPRSPGAGNFMERHEELEEADTALPGTLCPQFLRDSLPHTLTCAPGPLWEREHQEGLPLLGTWPGLC